MTHSLEELKSGKLIGSKTLKLACGLEEFPEEVVDLKETLEVLDLSDNNLSKLPDNLSQLKKLRIVFFANNNFTEFPSVLANCPSLSMIGFKSNHIKTVSENAFPITLKWLILTNNKIEKLESINNIKKIYKSDSLKLAELTELENRIFKRTHYSDRLRNLDLSQINILRKSDTTEIISPVIKNDSTTINKPIRSFFWMVLTSGYFFIILIITLIILPFRGYPHNELKNVLGSIAGIIIFIGVIGFLTWVAYTIPIISSNHPYLNYILNAILQSPLIYLIFWWNKKD
mgnify:CR=1 FL=1